MEIIIGLVVLGVIAYFGYKHFNKEKADGSHPLDSVTVAPVVEAVAAPAKAEETKVDVRETVSTPAPAVAEKPAAPKKPKAAKKPAAAKPAGSAKPKAPKKPKMTVVK